MLQQKSSAAGFHLELWNNDMRDDLSVALAQHSMYPLIFLAVLLHDHQDSRSYLYSALNILIRMSLDGLLKLQVETKGLPGFSAQPCCSLYLDICSQSQVHLNIFNYMNATAMI